MAYGEPYDKEMEKHYMANGAGAFSGAMYRQGWYNQIVFAMRTREYATVWIFGNRGPQYLVWGTSTDGALDCEEVIWTKEEANQALHGFLSACKKENVIESKVFRRDYDKFEQISMADLKKKSA